MAVKPKQQRLPPHRSTKPKKTFGKKKQKFTQEQIVNITHYLGGGKTGSLDFNDRF